MNASSPILYADPQIYRIVLRLSGKQPEQLKFYHDLFRVNFALLNLYMHEWPMLDGKPADLFQIFRNILGFGGFLEAMRIRSGANEIVQRKDTIAQIYCKYLLVFEYAYTQDGKVPVPIIQFSRRMHGAGIQQIPKRPGDVYFMQTSSFPPVSRPIKSDDVVPYTGRPITKPYLDHQVDLDAKSISIDLDQMLNHYMEKQSIQLLCELIKEVEKTKQSEAVARSRIPWCVAAEIQKLLKQDSPIDTDYQITNTVLPLYVNLLSAIIEKCPGLFQTSNCVLQIQNIQIDLLQLNNILVSNILQIQTKFRLYAAILAGGKLEECFTSLRTIARVDPDFSITAASLVNSQDQRLKAAGLSVLRALIFVPPGAVAAGIDARALAAVNALPDSIRKQLIAPIERSSLYPAME